MGQTIIVKMFALVRLKGGGQPTREYISSLAWPRIVNLTSGRFTTIHLPFQLTPLLAFTPMTWRYVGGFNRNAINYSINVAVIRVLLSNRPIVWSHKYKYKASAANLTCPPLLCVLSFRQRSKNWERTAATTFKDDFVSISFNLKGRMSPCCSVHYQEEMSQLNWLCLNESCNNCFHHCLKILPWVFSGLTKLQTLLFGVWPKKSAFNQDGREFRQNFPIVHN